MKTVLLEKQGNLARITLNRPEKSNAFDDELIELFTDTLTKLKSCQTSRVILLSAKGRHFSAGADLSWMQRMQAYSHEENISDAKKLSQLLHTLHTHPLPTIALVQGSAFGGGAGLVAACDIAIASEEAKFAFTETRLGLIPSVISPYVIKAIGPRVATKLFLSAEVFGVRQAQYYQLISSYFPHSELQAEGVELAEKIASNGPKAVQAAKQLIDSFAYEPITQALLDESAKRIADIRVSEEGQEGLRAFLEKRTPNWSH